MKREQKETRRVHFVLVLDAVKAKDFDHSRLLSDYPHHTVYLSRPSTFQLFAPPLTRRAGGEVGSVVSGEGEVTLKFFCPIATKLHSGNEPFGVVTKK